MGLLRKSEETATRTDPLASWGERAWKAVLWIFGPSTLLGAAVTAWGWLAHNPQYGFLIGLITFTVFQAGLTFNAIRKSRAQKGPMAQLGYPASSGEVAGDGSAPNTGNRGLAQETDAAAAQTDTAQDAAQLKTELDEAKQEIEKLRIELNNRPPRHFTTPVTTVDTITSDKAKEIEAEKQRRNAEIEELKVENERLCTDATSPEVAKQKRLCFHLADDLRSLYREFQDGERTLIAHLQEQEDANIPEGEREEERHTKQLDLENKMRNKYHSGFPDRLEKLYEEQEPGGWLGPNDETLFMNLTDPNDIRKVADRLEEVGRNLL